MTFFEAHGTVVVGVDGSDSSRLALDWAGRHADQAHRPLLVTHVVTQATGNGSEAGAEYLVATAADRVHALHPGLEVRTAVALGNPADVLEAAAQTAHLVVVGPRGRGPVESVLLGSVSLSLLGRGGCPVVVVRPISQPVRNSGHPVVVGIDGGAASSNAAEFAFRQASYDGLPLNVVHCTWDPLPYSAPMADALTEQERTTLRAEEDLAVAETLAGLAEKYPDVAVHRLNGTGDPARVLAEMSVSASLVVVGSHGHWEIASSLIGSVSRRLVEHASSPVVVVRG
jgi:nucleotide-binding universal stress UspA family protein